MARVLDPPTLLDHVVLEVRDAETSARFYGRILGLPAVRLEDFRAGDAPFVSARVNPQTVIDFFPPAMWRNRRRSANPNHFCITMAARAVRALKRRLAKDGIPIARRLRRSFGAQGYANSIYFDDPDGISVEVRYYGAAGRRHGAPKAAGRARR
jgi:catechol 2,3-dioxygenase-like lactoylglutathione lyase family enzyme